MNAHPDKVTTLIFGAALLALYMLPAIIALCGRHRQTTAITTLNLLCGWTFIGWIVALIWALAKPRIYGERVRSRGDPGRPPAGLIVPRSARVPPDLGFDEDHRVGARRGGRDGRMIRAAKRAIRARERAERAKEAGKDERVAG